MKYTFSIALLTASILTLAACGEKKEAEETTPAVPAEVTPSAPIETPPAPAETTPPAEIHTPAEQPSSPPATEPEKQ